MAQITQEDVNVAYSIRESQLSPTLKQKVEGHYRVTEMVSGAFRIQKRVASTWETIANTWPYDDAGQAFSKMDQLIREAVDEAEETTVKRVIVERP